MKEVTLEALAQARNLAISILLQQLADLGIYKEVGGSLTKAEYERFIKFLDKEKSSESMPQRLTLQRKTRSTLSIPGSSGRQKAVQIEVRKKRTYIRPSSTVLGFDVNPSTANEVFEHPQAPSPSTAADTEKLEVSSQASSFLAKKPVPPDLKSSYPKPGKPQVTPASPVEEVKGILSANELIEHSKKEQRESEMAALRQKAEQEARRMAELEAIKVAEAAKKMAEENTARWEKEAREREESPTKAINSAPSGYRIASDSEDDMELETHRRSRARIAKTVKQKKSGKFADSRIKEEVVKTLKASKEKQIKGLTLQQAFNKPVQPIIRDIFLSEAVVVADLANKLAVKGAEVIKILMRLGIMATINQVIDQDTAQLVCEELGHNVVLVQENALEESLLQASDENLVLEPRAPIVTIMGHVDHGKTSLLDYIRSTKVAVGEAGGITQKIGAYHVETSNGMITFLDTPGHSAFTAMRARGAKLTDIVVLVIAADDGVMPQTVEAIQHAKAANVAIVVALTKMDKPGVNPEKIKQELTQYDVLSEEWGGLTQFVSVSAKTGQGIDALLEAILLQAELLELSAPKNMPAVGVVVESYLDKGRGPVATILVQKGTLKQGDVLLCGFEYGRVRAMRNERGETLQIATPSIPVEILGLSGIPCAGEEARVVRDEKKAREVALYRKGKSREIKLSKQQKSTFERLFEGAKEHKLRQELNIVLKADVQGLVEAIRDSLMRLATDEVQVKIVGSGTGGITETDASLAAASSALLVGFNVRADNTARQIVETEHLDLRYYSVIYDLLNDVKKIMSGLLLPEYKQQILGMAEVRDVFRSPKFGVVAGCMVTEGIIKRNSPIRVLRQHVVIYEGELESLRRFKEDVSEVRSGTECGIGIKNYNDVQRQDLIEVYETIEIARTID